MSDLQSEPPVEKSSVEDGFSGAINPLAPVSTDPPETTPTEQELPHTPEDTQPPQG